MLEKSDGTEAERPNTRVTEVLQEINIGTIGGNWVLPMQMQQRFYWVTSKDDIKDCCRMPILVSISQNCVTVIK